MLTVARGCRTLAHDGNLRVGEWCAHRNVVPMRCCADVEVLFGGVCVQAAPQELIHRAAGVPTRPPAKSLPGQVSVTKGPP
jgi:hypothetical protein